MPTTPSAPGSEDPQDAGCGNHAWSLTTVGAVFGLLVGLTATHELLVGHRLPLWVSRIQVRIPGPEVSIWGLEVSRPSFNLGITNNSV